MNRDLGDGEAAALRAAWAAPPLPNGTARKAVYIRPGQT